MKNRNTYLTCLVAGLLLLLMYVGTDFSQQKTLECHNCFDGLASGHTYTYDISTQLKPTGALQVYGDGYTRLMLADKGERNPYERLTQIFVDLAKLNNADVDAILAKRGVSIADKDGTHLFPRPCKADNAEHDCWSTPTLRSIEDAAKETK